MGSDLDVSKDSCGERPGCKQDSCGERPGCK